METKLKLNKTTRILSNVNNGNILVNQKTGGWAKIGDSLLKSIDYICKKDLALEEVILLLANNDTDKQDKLEHFFNKLIEAELLVSCGLENHDKNRRYEQISVVYLIITDRCNLACRHCLAISNRIDMEFKTAHQIVEKLEAVGVSYIILTGGEPLLYENFWSLVKFINENTKIKLSLQTNGTLLNDTACKKIKKYEMSVDISLDGVNEETCTPIRGAGTFTKAINSIKRLKYFGVEDIATSMVVTRYTENKIHEYEALNKKLGIGAALRRLSSVGRARENYDEFRTSIEEKDQLVEPLAKESILASREILKALPSCSGLTRSIAVDPKGDVFPCPNLRSKDLKAGNILADNKILHTIKNSTAYKTFQELLVDNQKACSGCNVRYFCQNGGCYAENLFELGKLNMAGTDKCRRWHARFNQLLWSK